ncbi:MAG TPA: Spy/CpxP family protein refolding chaperone [Bryobacteraceae bacterium]|jgi:Spy/CpxP family protein refolding chaperone
MKLPMIALTILTAGVMSAQTTAPQQATTPHRAGAARQGQMLQRLTARLNLTPDQQAKAKVILKDSREQTKGLSANFREERKALNAAMKSDSEQQIDQIIQQNANLNSQMEAIHLKTIAKVYAILTPGQKAKFDERLNRDFRRGNGV